VLAHLRTWARSLRNETVALAIAVRDPRTPWYARALGVCVVAYALSPLDLLPDFIPVLGLLDDLVIVPAGLWALRRMIPAPVMHDARERATTALTSAGGRWVAALIVVLWLGAAAAVAWWLRQRWPRT